MQKFSLCLGVTCQYWVWVLWIGLMTSLFRRKSWFECSGHAVIHRATSCRAVRKLPTSLRPFILERKKKINSKNVFFLNPPNPKLKKQTHLQAAIWCASATGFAGRVKQLRAEVLALFVCVCLAWVVGVFGEPVYKSQCHACRFWHLWVWLTRVR